jgi:hypothetical protein
VLHHLTLLLLLQMCKCLALLCNLLVLRLLMLHRVGCCNIPVGRCRRTGLVCSAPLLMLLIEAAPKLLAIVLTNDHVLISDKRQSAAGRLSGGAAIALHDPCCCWSLLPRVCAQHSQYDVAFDQPVED